MKDRIPTTRGGGGLGYVFLYGRISASGGAGSYRNDEWRPLSVPSSLRYPKTSLPRRDDEKKIWSGVGRSRPNGTAGIWSWFQNAGAGKRKYLCVFLPLTSSRLNARQGPCVIGGADSRLVPQCETLGANAAIFLDRPLRLYAVHTRRSLLGTITVFARSPCLARRAWKLGSTLCISCRYLPGFS